MKNQNRVRRETTATKVQPQVEAGVSRLHWDETGHHFSAPTVFCRPRKGKGGRRDNYRPTAETDAFRVFQSARSRFTELGPVGAKATDLTDEQLAAWEEVVRLHLVSAYWQISSSWDALDEVHSKLPSPWLWNDTPFGRISDQYMQLLHSLGDLLFEDFFPKRLGRPIAEIVHEARKKTPSTK